MYAMLDDSKEKNFSLKDFNEKIKKMPRSETHEVHIRHKNTVYGADFTVHGGEDMSKQLEDQLNSIGETYVAYNGRKYTPLKFNDLVTEWQRQPDSAASPTLDYQVHFQGQKKPLEVHQKHGFVPLDLTDEDCSPEHSPVFYRCDHAGDPEDMLNFLDDVKQYITYNNPKELAEEHCDYEYQVHDISDCLTLDEEKFYNENFDPRDEAFPVGMYDFAVDVWTDKIDDALIGENLEINRQIPDPDPLRNVDNSLGGMFNDYTNRDMLPDIKLEEQGILDTNQYHKIVDVFGGRPMCVTIQPYQDRNHKPMNKPITYNSMISDDIKTEDRYIKLDKNGKVERTANDPEELMDKKSQKDEARSRQNDDRSNNRSDNRSTDRDNGILPRRQR